MDKECNENIDKNQKKVNNSKSCNNRCGIQTKHECKNSGRLNEGSVGYENNDKTESDVSVTDFDIDSSETEIDSHFDDNNERNKIINKSNYSSKRNSDLSKNKNTFICDFFVCNKTFDSLKSLEKHRLIHSDAKLLKCPHSGSHFSAKNLVHLARHKTIHLKPNKKSIERRVCNHNNCGNTYKRKCDLRCHQLSRHPEMFPDIEFIKCSKNECNYKTKLKSLMDSHLITHLELNPDSQELECNEIGCNYRTKILKNLKKHKRTHNLLSCEFCEFKFRSRERLENHISRKHTGIRPYVCSIDNCLKSYASKRGFLSHKRTRHNQALDLYKCQWNGCGKQFKLITSYKQHMIRHKGNERFDCDWNQCKRKFISKSKLNDHLNAHTGNKPYVCEWPGCEKRFQTSTHLNKHRKIHKSDVNYECNWPQCHYKTYRKDNFDKHMAKHTGFAEKRFACIWPECQYKTANQSNLITHKKIHQKY